MENNLQQIRQTLAFALEKYPHQVEVASVDQLLLDAARASGKRPAYLKLAVPDDTVKSLRGRKPSTDHVLLVRLPRELAERAASPIVLPNEVG